MEEVPCGEGAGVTAVLKLLRPRGGARPSKFRLPGYGENEIKVGRNGEVCDVFLYVDEHPSFLSRVHAIFRHRVPEVEDPDTGSSDEEDVTEEEKASTDDRGFATQPSSSQTQPNMTQGELVPVTTPSPSRTRDQTHPQPQPQLQPQPQPQLQPHGREQANQANAQTHVHAQALAQIFNQIARSSSRSARSFSTPGTGNVSASTRRSVSRTHAAVEKTIKKPQWEVIDQDSVNGVFLNGDKLEPKVPHVLEQGDRIFFGNPLHSFFLEYEYLELRSDSKEALEFERIAQRKREQKRAKSKANSQLPFSFRNNSIRYTENALNANRSALLNEVSQSISSSNRRLLRENYLQFHDAFMNSLLRQNASTLLAHDLQLPVGQRRKRSRDLFESRGNLSTEQSLAFAPYFHEHSGQHTGSVNSIGNPSDLALTPLKPRKAPRCSSVASDEGTMMDEGDSASTEGDDVASDLKVDAAVHSSGDFGETLDQAGRKGQHSKQIGATKSLLLEKLGKDLWHIMLSFLELPEIFRMRSVCKEIKRLNDFSLGMVKHIKWSPDQTRLDTFLKLCPNIIEIDASGCYDLGDSHVEIVAQRVPNIEKLDLSGCARISDRSIRALTENCDKIRSLRLRACKRIAATEAVELLTILGEKCTNLTHLDMRCCNLDDESLITLLSKCNNLTYLDIGSTGFARVSDRVLFALAKHCTKLEDLGVMCCREITDAGIERVAQGCGRTLRNLTVHCCFHLTDLSLVYLSKYCERLETLNVHRCVKISEFGFEQLAMGCGKTLRSLDVSACIVNDGALTSIAQNCPNLRILDLRSCEDITSIFQIAKHCPELEQLDLTCCKNLDDRAVYALATYCKKLTQIEFGKSFNISKAAHEVLQKALGDSASLYF